MLRRDQKDRNYSTSLDERETRLLREKNHPIVRVRYCDHAIFKAMKIENVDQCEREAIGRIGIIDQEKIILLVDYPFDLIIDEKTDLLTGLVILKSCIYEISCFNVEGNNLRSCNGADYLHQTMAE